MSFVLKIQQVVGFFHGDVYHGVESVKNHQTNKIQEYRSAALCGVSSWKKSPSLDIVPFFGSG